MALLNKIRKDIKKSSYYVWFLGAQESKGLRGTEYIIPVLRSLVEREKNIEPFKITLQVSHKGLKIVQTLSSLHVKKTDSKASKTDVIKHVIPHHAVTCVYQEDDVVACILLLYNPVTRCPVHVHAYRCDTVDTATLLTQQLSTLIERPDNQRKLGEIEARLRAKGLLLPTVPRVNIGLPRRLNSSASASASASADGRSATTSPTSESSSSSSGGCYQQERLTHLYDSLAAELREKLGMNTDSKAVHAPILLPPRDYDTVHRQKGNLSGIDMRRCQNENITGRSKVGDRGFGRMLSSSIGSSGIGSASDHPPSPEQTDHRYHLEECPIPAQTTSDDEWTEQPCQDSLFQQVSAATASNNVASASWRQSHPDISAMHSRSEGKEDVRIKCRSASRERATDGEPLVGGSHQSSRSQPHLGISLEHYKQNIKGMSPVGVVAPRRRVSEDRPPVDNSYQGGRTGGAKLIQQEKASNQYNEEDSNKWNVIKGKKVPGGTMKLSPHERFVDAKSKFLMLEKERLEEQEKNFQNLERKRCGHIESPIAPDINKGRPNCGWPKADQSVPGKIPEQGFFDEDESAFVELIATSKPNVEMTEDDKELFVEKIRKNFSKQEIMDLFDSMQTEKIAKKRDKRQHVKEGTSESRDFAGPIEATSAESSRPRMSGDYTDDYNKGRLARENSRLPHLRYYHRDEKREADWAAGETGPVRRYGDDRYSPSPPRIRSNRSISEENHERERMRSPVPELQRAQVPYEGRSKIVENEKRLHSNALAREFQRRSYMQHTQHESSDIHSREFARRSYAERDLNERYVRGRNNSDDDPLDIDVIGRNAHRKDYAPREDIHRVESTNRNSSKNTSYYDEGELMGRGSPSRGGFPGLMRERGSANSHHRLDDRVAFHEPPLQHHNQQQLHLDRLPARYRHSYVEQPSLSLLTTSAAAPSNGRPHEMIHRTNSSASSNRIGIAALHPY